MKNTIRLFSLLAIGAVACFAQLYTLSSTTASAALTSGATRFAVASVTGMTVASANAGTSGSGLYVYDTPGGPGEFMVVTAIDTTNLIVSARRGQGGTKAVAHLSGALVLYGAQNLFYSTDAQGACTTANTTVTPHVNILTGGQQLCSTVTLSWVPSFNHAMVPGNAGPTTAVAAPASSGTITPSGALFHLITNTGAITGFVLPLGFAGGSFTIIPDVAATWTAAGNIVSTGTFVVGKACTFVYDKPAGKFYPSY